MIRNISLAFCLVLSNLVVQSQDVQFSEYNTVAQYLNPALTGNFDGKYRILTVYRDQARGALEQPLTTYGFGGDVKFDIGSAIGGSGDMFGAGIFFLSDQAPTFEMNTNAISLNLAYHKRLNKKSNDFLSLGLLIGVQQRNINYDNLNFGDEFNFIDAYDQQTGELLPPNNFGFADLGTGLTYSTKPSERLGVFIGAALHHLNQPKLSFYSFSQVLDPVTQVDFQLDRKATLHASIDYQFGDFISLLPNVVFITQGEYSQINAGSYLKFDFKQTRTSLYTGMWYRLSQGTDNFSTSFLVPTIGFELGNFLLGFSYDINANETFTGQPGLNTFEFSMRFLGSFENDDYFCPQF